MTVCLDSWAIVAWLDGEERAVKRLTTHSPRFARAWHPTSPARHA
jgi:hypothetical protein